MIPFTEVINVNIHMKIKINIKNLAHYTSLNYVILYKFHKCEVQRASSQNLSKGKIVSHFHRDHFAINGKHSRDICKDDTMS